MEDFIVRLFYHLAHTTNDNVLLTYLFFFASAVLQLIFPPFPSDVIIILQGYLTTISESFSFLPVLLTSVIGSLLGSTMVYIFGYRKGNEVLRYKIVLRFVDKKHLIRTEKLFHKYGKYGLILSKFIPGTSSIMVLFSGVFRIKAKIYLGYIIFSIFLQQVIYMLIGRVIGNNIDKVNKFLSFFNVFSILILVIVIILAYILYRSRKGRGANNKL